jgi:uroporphyrinogen-III synthase
MARDSGRCRALLLGPDPPPRSLGVCETVWLPLHRPIAVSGSSISVLETLPRVQAIAFTSPRAVRALAVDARFHGIWDRLRGALSQVAVAVVGPRTASEARRWLGVEPSLMASTYTGASLGEKLSRAGVESVLWARGYPAGEGLRRALQGRALLVEVVVYVLVDSGLGPLLNGILSSGGIDYVVVTSPSIASIVAPKIRGLGAGVAVIAIGPTTARALTSAGLEPSCIPSAYNLDGVGECINQLENRGRTGA